jgi:rhamnose utilization protein RhaD (predicted bifunctional aldolase and dehydrogenase)
MQENKDLNNLVKMSHLIGSSIAYVQGGGGNTSVKLDNTQMAIKASGVPLKDMQIDQGIAIVNYNRVNSYHDSPALSEDAYSDAINNFALAGSGRPSIETGFHALLGKYVIHSHSVFLNVLLCSEEGKNIVISLFPDSVWVNYCTPGKNLTLAIKKALEETKDVFEGLIFLESHGMISTASSYQKCIDLHNECNMLVKSKFSLNDFLVQENIETASPEYFIFPDQAIYMSAEQIEKKTKASIETVSAVQYLESSMKHLGLTPKKLSNENIRVLNNMSSEKYRKTLSK